MTSATLPTALPSPFFSSFPSRKLSWSTGAIIGSHPKQNVELRCSLYLLDLKSCTRIADPMLRPSGWCHSGVQNSRKRFGRLEGNERRSQKVATNAGSGSYWITVAQAFGVAFGFAGMGVIAGFLINYNLWKEAQEDAKQALEEYESSGTPLPMSVEEIMATQNAGKVRNRPTRKSEKGS